ncbi:hypothetical protein FS749_008135 [Ceratobasidium sp. UAMH 11750]|nr:hypothetical protein FS749_008135 [Ceratobasidium sp. UAMH 11750]
MPIHQATHAGPQTPTFGLFAPHEHLAGQQAQSQSAPSSLPSSPLNASDPLSSMLASLTLDSVIPQVPVQPQQAINQAEHADSSGSYNIQARNYQRALETYLIKSTQNPIALPDEQDGDYPDMV